MEEIEVQQENPRYNSLEARKQRQIDILDLIRY